MNINEKVKETISKQLNKPIEEVTDEKEIVKDLGADSLDVVEMLMNLEDEYSISVPEEEAINIVTVSDIVKIIEEKSK